MNAGDAIRRRPGAALKCAIAPQPTEAAAVFTERETKTAASRTCVVLIDASIDRETVWRRILRKEVIQPQVPLRLPCYDFTPVMNHTVANVPPKVRLSASGATHSHGVTGGVYKARERIHRGMLIRDY